MSEQQQQANEELPGGKIVEPRTYPLSRTLGFGASTLAIGGIVDLVAHLGPTGLVVGALAAYVVAKHGPEVVESFADLLPDTHPKAPVLPPSTPTKRSVLDRALGRFPQEQVPQENEMELLDFEEEEESAEVVDVELQHPTVADPAIQPTPRIAPIYRARHTEREVLLSPRLGLDIDEVIDAGLFIAGMKGSGKSTVAARVMEQTGRFPFAQVIYDIKGDFLSLVDSHFINGLVMTQSQQYDAETIHQCRLQVVVDLRTWETIEEWARVIADLNQSLLKYAMRLPEEERIPWFVHLDEAQQYVSQQKPDGIELMTWKAVTASVMNLGVLGRSYGAVPCLYTQRIAEIHKSVISQQELRIFMKAALDNDLKRYEEYINAQTASRTDIQAFGKGDAVVILPDGRQLLTHFLDRESKHGSHTPHLTQALRLQQAYRPVPVAKEQIPSAEPPVRAMPMREQVASYTSARTYPHPTKRLPPELQRALDAYKPGMSFRQLADALGDVNKDTAGKYIKQLRERRLIV